jgi:hypothetical protein
LQRGLSFGVRYEDLWYSPVKTLEALTNNIHPIPSTRIQATVENCRLENMRTAAGQDASFFAAAARAVGKPASLLPPSQSLRELPPYLLQFKWLGYSLNSVDQVPDGSSEYALKGADSDSSYFSWVNAAADDDPHAGRIAPLITQLGAYLYHSRRDLLEIFPDPYGRDRVAFSHWFTELSQVGSKKIGRPFSHPCLRVLVAGPSPELRARASSPASYSRQSCEIGVPWRSVGHSLDQAKNCRGRINPAGPCSPAREIKSHWSRCARNLLAGGPQKPL